MVLSQVLSNAAGRHLLLWIGEGAGSQKVAANTQATCHIPLEEPRWCRFHSQWCKGLSVALASAEGSRIMTLRG